MNDSKPLAGKTAIVTGASKGIGAATAQALAEAGTHVILVARDVKGLEAVEDAIHASGGTSTIAPLDLTEKDAIVRLSQAISGRWEAIDYLVLAAAYLPELTPVTQIDPKQFTQALLTNVSASQAMLAAFDPMLKRAEGGCVIGLTSSVGASPRAYWSAYGSSKAAFDNLLDCYAQEVGSISKVRVAIIDPGATRTQMRERAFPGEDPATLKPPKIVADRLVQLLGEDFQTGHRERID